MSKKESAVDRIKKLHQAQSIVRKDISLKDILEQESTDGTLILKVKGISSKFVPKYASEENLGFQTLLYLEDGRKVGAFSNALYTFAEFFYKGAGLMPGATFNKIDFNDGYLAVKVTKVELEKKKSTYNFEIADGEIGKCELMTDGNKEGSPLLLEGEIQ